MSAPLRNSKRGEYFLGFLILSVISTSILLAGLALGIEPRLMLERSADDTFRVTGSNHFAGKQFFSKTVDGVRGFSTGSAARNRRIDSAKEERRRSKQKHLAFYGKDGARVAWDREGDRQVLNEFILGKEAKLELTDPPPGWRIATAWFCIGFGMLTFIGAIQSRFFPKKNPATPWT